MKHGEITIEEKFLVVPSPRLTAGSLFETPRLHENHGSHRQPVSLGDSTLNSLYGRSPELVHGSRPRGFGLSTGGKPAFIHLRNYNEFFNTVVTLRNGRAGPQANRSTGPLHGEFDVARVVVTTGDDDHILQPAGQVDLAIRNEAQVPGAEKGSLVRVGETPFKSGSGFFRQPPVAAGNTWALHPQFANLVGIRLGERDRVYGDYPMTGSWTSATYNIAAAGFIVCQDPDSVRLQVLWRSP